MENVKAACALAYERELFLVVASVTFRVASYATTVPVPTAPGAPGLPVVSINSSVRNNDPIKTRACESQMSNTERPSEPMIIL